MATKIIEFTDGRIYTGQVRNGKMHGKGTLKYPEDHDCIEYRGSFIDGKKDGYGIQTWVDMWGVRVKYLGDWKDDKMNGGTTIWENGLKFEDDRGDWKDGKPHGHWSSDEISFASLTCMSCGKCAENDFIAYCWKCQAKMKGY